MKKLALICILMLTGCGNNTNPKVVDFAHTAKAQENASYKQSKAEMKERHEQEQARYDDMIKHPGKYAEVCAVPATYHTPQPQPAVGDILVEPGQDVTDPNTPAVFNIPAKKDKN